jgi:hypothetical protein
MAEIFRLTPSTALGAYKEARRLCPVVERDAMRTITLHKTNAPLLVQSLALAQRASAATAITARFAKHLAFRFNAVGLRLLKDLRRTTAAMTSHALRHARVYSARLGASAAQSSMILTGATRRAGRLAKVTGPLLKRRARRFAKTKGPLVTAMAVTMVVASAALARNAKRRALAAAPHVRDAAVFAHRHVRNAAVFAHRRLGRAAVVSRQSSRAVAVFAVEYTRRSMVVAKPRLARASDVAVRHGRRAARALGRGLRKFAGTEVALDSFELDREDALLLEERARAALRARPLPSFHEIQPISGHRFVASETSMQEPANDATEITEVCTPAVVLLAKTSGGEARIECSPIGLAAPSLRPARVAHSRSGR